MIARIIRKLYPWMCAAMLGGVLSFFASVIISTWPFIFPMLWIAAAVHAGIFGVLTYWSFEVSGEPKDIRELLEKYDDE